MKFIIPIGWDFIVMMLAFIVSEKYGIAKRGISPFHLQGYVRYRWAMVKREERMRDESELKEGWYWNR